MADTEKREHQEHQDGRKDLERIKTAREILEEKLAGMKSEAPKAEQALKEAAERAPGGSGSGSGSSTGADTGTGTGTRQEAQGTGTGTATGTKAVPETVDERVARAEKERDEYRAEALRARADLDNYQKRIRREMDEIRTFAAAGVLTDVIAALDNLDFSIAAAKQKPDLALFMQGVEMARAQFEKLVEDRGAVRIPAAGVPFDPRRHEGVLVEERADVPDGTAIAELRRGYAMRDRVLRAAQVKVSRAPAPKPAGEAPGDGEKK